MQEELLQQADLEEKNANEADKFLTFFVDEKLFAIPSNNVMDIISMQKITYMPKLPPYVKGVTNIRGKIVPLIELRMRFNKETKPYTERTCIVITETDECRIGYIVDKVNDVTDILPTQISEPPHITDTYAKYIVGVTQIGEGIALLLDTAKLIEDESIPAEI